MEERVKVLLEKHGCEFVKQLTECRILWKNQVGAIREDDVSVLSCMCEKAWDFWKVAP